MTDFVCNWASIGHPNEKGAEKYSEAIIQALEQMSFDPRPKWVEYVALYSTLGSSDVLPAISYPIQ
jgi:hypothetical protein